MYIDLRAAEKLDIRSLITVVHQLGFYLPFNNIAQICKSVVCFSSLTLISLVHFMGNRQTVHA